MKIGLAILKTNQVICLIYHAPTQACRAQIAHHHTSRADRTPPHVSRRSGPPQVAHATRIASSSRRSSSSSAQGHSRHSLSHAGTPQQGSCSFATFMMHPTRTASTATSNHRNPNIVVPPHRTNSNFLKLCNIFYSNLSFK